MLTLISKFVHLVKNLSFLTLQFRRFSCLLFNLNIYIMNIYVANLGQETSEEQVRSAFSNYGEVESVKLITDQFTGRLKGFGFIEMPNTEEAEEAIKELNNSKFDNQFLVVNEARPKASNNGFSSNNRGSYSRSNDRQY